MIVTYENNLCFRRDRGATVQNVMLTFESNSFNQNRTAASAIGETIFVFVVPSLLHFCGFLSAVYVLRIADNEQLQNLVERVSTICIFNRSVNSYQFRDRIRFSYYVNFQIDCS